MGFSWGYCVGECEVVFSEWERDVGKESGSWVKNPNFLVRDSSSRDWDGLGRTGCKDILMTSPAAIPGGSEVVPGKVVPERSTSRMCTLSYSLRLLIMNHTDIPQPRALLARRGSRCPTLNWVLNIHSCPSPPSSGVTLVDTQGSQCLLALESDQPAF